ncbi:MAG: mandelate racemase [Planctomycetota bacterium]
MQLRVTAAAFAEVPCRTRTPFRFGAVTVHEAPLLHARVEVESPSGRAATGMAADLLVPRWFRKDPARSPQQDQDELRAAARAAADLLLQDRTPRRAFALWDALYGERVRAVDPTDADERLVRGFGTALLERAVIDAACRLANKSFWSALQQDLFGIELGRVHPELRGVDLRALLPQGPATSILLRHTLGMLDPLTDADAPPAAIDDGEPRSLEGYLARDELRWLKVKVGQGHDADRDRLLALARLLRGRDDVAITVDGNEQFADLGAVADLLDAVAADPDGAALLGRLAHVEQPLPRAHTFAADANRDLARVVRRAPLCLDEADSDPDAFRRALDLGWTGCSLKNCKGVFRALANFALARRRGGPAFVAAEDLTTLPLLSVQQDLATVTALGIPHVERNGHHYFRGLDHLPPAVARAASAAHGDLYAERTDGGATLCVHRGALRCASLLGPGFGCDQEPFDLLRAALPWQPAG